MKIRENAFLIIWIPVILSYVLPVTIESNLQIELFGANFFIFNFLLLLLFFLPKYNNISIWNRKKILFWAFAMSVGIMLNDGQYRNNAFFTDISCGSTFLFTLYIFSFNQITYEQLSKLKKLLLVTFFVLALEIVIYALGFKEASSIRIIENTAGVNRIPTTIGSPTATAGVIYVLGACVFSLLNTKLAKGIFLLIWIFIVMLTLSRGSLLGLLIFLCVWFIRNVDIKRHLWKSIMILSIIIGGVFYSGMLNPIIERQNYRSDNEDSLSGRSEYWEKSLNLWALEPVFGRGLGNVQPRDEYENEDTMHTFPHNSYLLLISEQGLVGVLFFLSIFIPILFKMWRYAERDNFYLLLTILITVLNTETLFFFLIFEVPLFTFITISLIKNEKYCIY